MLCHDVATGLLASGIDVRTVASGLGHRNPATTRNVDVPFVPEADEEPASALLHGGPIQAVGLGLTRVVKNIQLEEADPTVSPIALQTLRERPNSFTIRLMMIPPP